MMAPTSLSMMRVRAFMLLTAASCFDTASIPTSLARLSTRIPLPARVCMRAAGSSDEVSLGFLPSSARRKGDDFDDSSVPVILQHDLDRLTLPGQKQQLHLYDSSNLAALRAAMSISSTFMHVALDPRAASNRRFGVIAVGTKCRVLEVAPSSKANVRGETSPSLKADIVGISQCRVLEVTQFEPHVRARVQPIPAGASGDAESPACDTAALDAALAECNELRASLGLDVHSPEEEEENDANLARELAASAAGGDDEGMGDELQARTRIRAFRALRWLPGDRRAMALQIVDVDRLLDFALGEVRGEKDRLLAMKALRSVDPGQ